MSMKTNELGKPGVPEDSKGSTLPAPIVDLLGRPLRPRPANDTNVGARQVTLLRDTTLDFPCLGLAVHVVGDQFDKRAFSRMFVRALCHEALNVDDADLVVFTGGADVNPSLYGHAVYPRSGPFNDKRDTEEALLYLECREKGIPMFGVCRGFQFLHVMQGGKLWQDVDHHGSTHPMTCTATSTIIEKVSSVHHQMVIPDEIAGTDTGMQVIATNTSARNRMRHTPEKGERYFTNHAGVELDVEAGFYRDIMAFGVQGHPEYSGYNKYTQWTMEQIDRLISCCPDVDWVNGRLRIQDCILKEREAKEKMTKAIEDQSITPEPDTSVKKSSKKDKENK